MQKSVKRSICLFLCFIMTFALGGCSGGTKMSEKNIIKTVEKVEAALKTFDKDMLEKYVSSQTLKYIIGFSKSKPQFAELGQAMFEKLEIEVKSVDLEKATVTVAVKNRDMREVAANFTKKLTSEYDGLELLSKLADQNFLDESLGELKSEIAEATVPDNPAEVTLSIEQGAKNLILVFDSKAEDAVSGGALTAIIEGLEEAGQETPQTSEPATEKAEE